MNQDLAEFSSSSTTKSQASSTKLSQIPSYSLITLPSREAFDLGVPHQRPVHDHGVITDPQCCERQHRTPPLEGSWAFPPKT